MSLLNNGTTSNAESKASWRADGDSRFGRLGTSIAVADWNGDGSLELIIGAPRASVSIPPALMNASVSAMSDSHRGLQAVAATEMPGAVYIYSASF
jgi:hypothetical protein